MCRNQLVVFEPVRCTGDNRNVVALMILGSPDLRPEFQTIRFSDGR